MDLGRAPPSIASMTGSRVDSATKHVRTCRVGQDYVTSWLRKPLETLRTDKLLHAVQKDDIFIGCGPSVFGGSNGCYAIKKAYATGLGSLHDSSDIVRIVISLLTMVPPTATIYKALVDNLKDVINSDKLKLKDAEKNQLQNVPEFYFEGIALTTGFPHGHLGDTALSVLTGGMMTMRNGPFEMHAGDLVTWVWDFEIPFLAKEDGFLMVHAGKWHEALQILINLVNLPQNGNNMDEDATRQLINGFKETINNPPNRDTRADAKRRKTYFYDQNNNKSVGSNSKTAKRECIPLIIPLPVNYTYILRKRMFGRCLSYGRPYDMTDILVSRQGM